MKRGSRQLDQPTRFWLLDHNDTDTDWLVYYSTTQFSLILISLFSPILSSSSLLLSAWFANEYLHLTSTSTFRSSCIAPAKGLLSRCTLYPVLFLRLIPPSDTPGCVAETRTVCQRLCFSTEYYAVVRPCITIGAHDSWTTPYALGYNHELGRAFGNLKRWGDLSRKLFCASKPIGIAQNIHMVRGESSTRTHAPR